VADAARSVHGFPATLTSFVGRAAVLDEIAGRLGQDRLVTLTGPGGAGKTRLAGEAAKQLAGRFADGVRLAELAAVRPAAARVEALGVAQLPDRIDDLAAGPQPQTAAPGPEGLSPRERELVTLVARGHTDAQIAAQLYISVRTVSSHLDRIRDKTGCRRRADLTRLALSAGLV
jgi:DNA-binding CsgD family transcriptional regulator